MELAPWSFCYLTLVGLYTAQAAVRRRPLLDPAIVGGLCLSVFFLIEATGGGRRSDVVLFLMHLVACLGFWAGVGLAGVYRRSREERLPQSMRIADPARVWLVLVCFALCAFIVIFVIWLRGSFDTVVAMRSRSDLRFEPTGSLAAEVPMYLRAINYFRGYLCPATILAVFFCVRVPKRTVPRTAVTAVAVLAACIEAFSSGTRAYLVLLFLGVVFAVYYGMPRQSDRVRATLTVSVPLALTALALMALQTRYRDLGLRTERDLETVTISGSLGTMIEHLSFNRTVNFVLDAYPREYDYLKGHSLWAALVYYVPRPLWPGKPVSWGKVLATQMTGSEDINTSSAATIIGEGYANFGLAGWISFPLFWGFVMMHLFGFLQSPRDDFDRLLGLWCLFWALSLRGDIAFAATHLMLPYLVLVLGLRVAFFRRVEGVVIRPVAGGGGLEVEV